MISINHLASRQLLVRKGRTLLTGFAIMLGVASLLGLLVMGTSGSIIIEKQMRSNFGLADIRVVVEPTADQKKVARKVAGLSGVEGTAIEKMWVFVGNLQGKKYEFNVKAVDVQSPIAARLHPLSSGRLPKGDEEIALSSEFAQDRNYRIGQIFAIPLKTKTRKMKITGLINDGPRFASMAARAYVDLPFIDKFGTTDDVGSIAVIASDGNKDDSFVKDLILKIEKLDEVAFAVSANDILADALRSANILKALFMLAGAISLVVAITLIYSTFAITAMEREREFGLLKAMGANRRWVRRLVYREAVVLGSVFSLIGVLFGLGLSHLFLLIFIKTGIASGLDLSDLVITPRDLIVSFLVGTGGTLFSALLPARKVGKIHPLSSIRPQPESEQTVSKVRWIGLALIATSLAVLVMFAFSEDPEAIAPVGFSAALGINLGAAIFMPVVIGSLFNGLEKLSLRRIGFPGRLAAKNLNRQSLRSARTVISILIGISLVFLVAIFSESAVSSSYRILKEQVKYDLAITTSEESLATTPKELLDKVKKLKEVEQFTAVRQGFVKIAKLNGQGRELSSGEDKEMHKNGMMPFVVALDPKLYPELSDLFFSKDKNGREIWEKLSGDYVLVNKNYWATALDVKPGDRLKLSGKDGKTATFKVLGYFDAFLVGARRSTGAIVMSQANAKHYLGITEDYDVLVKLKSNVDKTAVAAKIGNLVRGTQFQVSSNEQISKNVENFMAGPQAFLYLLFGITVFVGLIGVVNTIAVGVLERRREIGLIKAVGGTRKHVKLMIILESILISLVGAVLGIGLSTGVAALFNRAIHANDFMPSVFTFPVLTMALLIAAVILTAILGALFPIRMSNRYTPIEALRFE